VMRNEADLRGIRSPLMLVVMFSRERGGSWRFESALEVFTNIYTCTQSRIGRNEEEEVLYVSWRSKSEDDEHKNTF
jgi:hypothetical protein